MHALVKPKYFIPVHGEYRMLWQHAVLAESMGMNSTDIVLPETGQVIEMNQEGLYLAEQIPTGAVLVDGLGIGRRGQRRSARPQAPQSGRLDYRRHGD